MSVKRDILDGPIDWLAAIVISWLIPLGLMPWVHATYFTSLVLWLVPIVLLLPRFLQKSNARSRRAMAWTVTYIAVGGAILDVLFGGLILKFGPASNYIIPPIRAVGGTVPVEEFLFYIMGGIAIVAVYFWADAHWLALYQKDEGARVIPEGRLLFVSNKALIIGALLFALGVIVKWVHDGRFGVRAYFSFLVAIAFVPAIALAHNAGRFVNWRAFALTTLYVLLTSCLWEATLALKNEWWGYKPERMLGINVKDWGTPFSDYPIEALLVWLVVSFACVLTYEAVKTYHYDPRPGMREKLIGR